MTIRTPRVAQEIDPRARLSVPVPIDLFQCQTTAGTAFTADSSAEMHIHSLVASNVTGTADSITVYLVPDGGSAGATNLYVSQKEVPARDWVTIFDANNVGLLQPGATLQVLCGVNDAVNIFGWGYEYSGAYG